MRRHSRGSDRRGHAGYRVNGSLYASTRAEWRRDNINSTLVTDEKYRYRTAGAFGQHRQLAATPWQKISQPISGSAQSIGAFANGCIVGAQPLPLNSPDYR